jgi:hypothetical protein
MAVQKALFDPFGAELSAGYLGPPSFLETVNHQRDRLSNPVVT